MRLRAKNIFILVSFFLSMQSFAYESDYVSVFKPVKQNKSIAELQSNIKEDVSKFRAMIKPREQKKMAETIENTKKASRSPASI